MTREISPYMAANSIEELLTATSGRPVLVKADPNCPGHATIRMAQGEDPAHLLRYNPAFEAELPYLRAFQYGLALRTFQADPSARFDLASTKQMAIDVNRLITDHLRRARSTVSAAMIPQLSSQLGSGLGLQLRSMPIAIRVDEWLWREYPALADFQRRNVERQLQEAMHALGPSVREFAPQEIIDANVGMSTAFAKFWAETWQQPELAVPFISAGYGKIGDDLLELVRTVDRSPNGDRELVDQWAKRVGIDSWFLTIDKP